MSQPIRKDEIVESGVLDNLIQPLIKAQEELQKTDAIFVKFTETVKNLNFSEKSKDLREFAAAEEQITKVYEEKKKVSKEILETESEVEKLKKKLAQATSEEAKQVAELKAELQAQNRELNNTAKAVQSNTVAYKELEKQTRQAKNESKELGAQLLQMRKAGQENTDEYNKLALAYTTSTQKAAELDKELKSLDKSVGDNFRNVGNYASVFEELNARVEQGGLGMREMSKLIREYEAIALNAGMTSPIGQQALAQAGQLKDRISDISAVTQALSTDTINLDAAKNTVTGLAGGYQAVQGAMALVGSENKDMLKVMAKLTAIQSVMNGLKSFEAMINKNNVALLKQTVIWRKAQTAATAAYTFVTKGATIATIALRAAMIALPIAALVAGVAVLVSKFGGWNKASKEATEQQKALAERTKEQSKAIAEQTSKFVGLVYQLKASNAGSKERETLMKKINDEYGTTLTNMSDEERFQKQLNYAVAEYIALQTAKFKQQKNQESFTYWLEKQHEATLKLQQYEKQLDRDRQKYIERRVAFGERAEWAEMDFNETLKDDRYLKKLNEDLRIAEKAMQTVAISGTEIQAEIDKMLKKSTVLTRETSTATARKAAQDRRFAAERMAQIEEVFKAEDEFTDAVLTNEQKQIKAVEEKYDKLIRYAEAYGYDIATLLRAQQREIDQIEADAHEQRQKDAFEARKKELEALNKQREIQNIQEAKSKEKFDKWEKQRHLEHLEAMLELEKEFGQETIDTRLAIAKAKQDLQDKEKETLRDSYNTIAKSFEDIYIKSADRAIEAMRRQEEAAANMYSVFAQLAAEGNITAQQSLAEMINRQEELQRRQEQMERRKLRMQRASQASSILVNELDKGKSVPEALAAMGAFLAASESLIPSFYEGTENTGKGGKIDAKGGFAAILHPNERVLTASQNAKIGDIPNPVVADVMYKFRTGQLDSAGTSYDILQLKSELVSIRQAIENQPRQVVGLEETLSGVVKLATSTVKGNHRTTNRFQS